MNICHVVMMVMTIYITLFFQLHAHAMKMQCHSTYNFKIGKRKMEGKKNIKKGYAFRVILCV